MSDSILKIHKGMGKAKLTDFEKKFSKALYDIQTSKSSIAKEIQTLYVHKVDAYDVDSTTKCAVVFVPMPFLLRFKKIQNQLTQELEKKLPNYQVVFVGDRKIVRKDGGKSKDKKSFCNTATYVHNALLEDIVFPQNITGKQMRYSTTGNILTNVRLSRGMDSSSRFDAYSTIYQKLTGKAVKFETDM